MNDPDKFADFEHVDLEPYLRMAKNAARAFAEAYAEALAAAAEAEAEGQ